MTRSNGYSHYFSRCKPLRLMKQFFKLRLVWNNLIIYFSMLYFPGRVKNFLLRLTGADVHPSAFISPFVYFDPLHPELITIERGVFIGVGAKLFTHLIEPSSEHTYVMKVAPITLKEKSFVGGFTTIRSGITVNEFATIGSDSLVTRDVPAHSLVYGIPAKPRGSSFGENLVKNSNNFK